MSTQKETINTLTTEKEALNEQMKGSVERLKNKDSQIMKSKEKTKSNSSLWKSSLQLRKNSSRR